MLVPNIVFVKLSFNISLLIKAKSSNVAYALLSIEENKLLNNVFIVCVIASTIFVFSRISHPI